jgi:hypothetical protein
MSFTTAEHPPSSDPRPTDIAWAQNLIADLQADAALRHRWQQAEAAFSHEATADPTPERAALLQHLIHLGQALETNTQRLQFIWDHEYASITTPAAELAELHLRIFGVAADAA